MNCIDELLLQAALKQTYHVLNLTIQHAKDHNKKIYLAFSGGKDSLVLNHIVKNYFPIFDQEYILSHNMTGIDERETYQFLVKNFDWNGREERRYLKAKRKRGRKSKVDKKTIATYTKKQILEIAPPIERFFTALKRIKQIPSKFMRWCCDTCKHRNNVKNEKNNIVLMGIRSAESRARKKRYDWFNQNTSKGNKKYKCIMDIDRKNKTLKVNPLLHWTNGDIWNYIELHKIELPQGYGDRTGRKGCYLCPFMSKKDLFKQWNSDIPFVKTYKKVLQEIMDGKHGEYRHPWKDVNIWAAFVWFMDIKKVIKNTKDPNSPIKEYVKITDYKKQNPESKLNYDYYYYYYYEEQLKKDPWYLIRDEKWFKDLQKEGFKC